MFFQRIPEARKHFGDLGKLRTKSIKLYITKDSCVPLVASEQSSSGSDGADLLSVVAAGLLGAATLNKPFL